MCASCVIAPTTHAPDGARASIRMIAARDAVNCARRASAAEWRGATRIWRAALSFAGWRREEFSMPVTIDYSKLRILPDPDTHEWWAATRKHKYLVRKCNRCGHKWFPPNLPACSKCTSMDIDWFETAGKGVIHSYVVVTQPIVGARSE